VPSSEKDYLRFLWYEAGRIVIHRYQVHLFGKCDSPCVAMAAIFLQALTHRETFPKAFQTIAKASLVEDMADSRQTQKETKELIRQLIGFFPTCTMEIRKFAGNTSEIIKDLESEQRIKDLQDSKNMKDMFDHKIPPAKLKVLRLLWDFVLDLLGFNFDAVE
jgi:hypothetical protein